MRSKGAFVAVGVALLVLAAAVPGWAHHAFGAEFDSEKKVELKGTVTRMEWINPHTWIHIDVKRTDGAVERWMIEGGPPNALLRRGFTKNSLVAGTEVLVNGSQAKDGSRRANGRDLTLAYGRRMFMGSSGTGAPDDGKDPSEKK